MAAVISAVAERAGSEAAARGARGAVACRRRVILPARLRVLKGLLVPYASRLHAAQDTATFYMLDGEYVADVQTRDAVRRRADPARLRELSSAAGLLASRAARQRERCAQKALARPFVLQFRAPGP